jgi:hypothetical protein
VVEEERDLPTTLKRVKVMEKSDGNFTISKAVTIDNRPEKA